MHENGGIAAAALCQSGVCGRFAPYQVRRVAHSGILNAPPPFH